MQQLEISPLQKLLQTQQTSLEYFFQHIDLEEVEKVVQLCLKIKGFIVLSGVGKSGIIAEKIAATLMSTGTRALYLPAANFLHGDIGAVSSEDLVILLSKSGQTQELVTVVPHLREKGCQIAAVVSNPESPLANGVEAKVHLPVWKELCPYDLAPTTSTTVQLLFGDLLAMSLMREKGVSLDDYAANHPAGAIGRNVTKTVRDVMVGKEGLPLCRKEDRLMDAIIELSNKRCGCLLMVTDSMELKGIFTDGDLRRALEKDGAQALKKTMEELSSSDPVTLSPQTLIHHALQKMQSVRWVTVAPVIENQRVIGLIRMHDIIHEELD